MYNMLILHNLQRGWVYITSQGVSESCNIGALYYERTSESIGGAAASYVISCSNGLSMSFKHLVSSCRQTFYSYYYDYYVWNLQTWFLSTHKSVARQKVLN